MSEFYVSTQLCEFSTVLHSTRLFYIFNESIDPECQFHIRRHSSKISIHHHGPGPWHIPQLWIIFLYNCCVKVSVSSLKNTHQLTWDIHQKCTILWRLWQNQNMQLMHRLIQHCYVCFYSILML